MTRLLRPYHPQSPLPLWLFILIASLAAINVVRIATTPYSEDWPVDFRIVYLGQRLLVEGENPYDSEMAKQAWRDIAARDGFETRLMPGFPRTPLVYPPWALPIFTPFSALSYGTACRIWYLLIAAMIVGGVVMLTAAVDRRLRLIPFIDLLLLALAFKATDWAVTVGQPMFLCLLLGAASLLFYARGRPLLAGVALGLASFKVTLVIPFALLMLYRRQWRVLAAAAVTVAVLMTVFLLLAAEPAAAIAGCQDNVARLRELIFSPDAPGYPLAFNMVSKTEITALAEYLFQGARHHSAILNLLPVLMLLPLWMRPLRLRPVHDLRVFLLFSVVTMLTTHHLHYDCLILLPIYLLARQSSPRESAALLLFGAVFLLPINGLLETLDLSGRLGVLYFNVQFALIGLAVALSRGLRTQQG